MKYLLYQDEVQFLDIHPQSQLQGIPFLRSFYQDFTIDDTVLADDMWYSEARFIDKYVIVRFEYSNLYDRKFLFLDHTLYNRQSIR